MTIGERIRYFRIQKHMTQEVLAAALNISYQAVSKWERNESLPDILLAARLADVLGVTCDALLTENVCAIESEIGEVIQQAAELDISDHEEYLRRADILEKALEKYPRSLRMMLELADTYSKGGNYPEFTEKNYMERTIAMEEYVAAHTTDPKLKYQTTAMLCYMYRGMEKYDRIRELAGTMPELYQTRPALLHHAMPGKQQLEGIHDFCRELIDMTENTLNLLMNPETAGKERELFVHLRGIIENRSRWNTRIYD